MAIDSEKGETRSTKRQTKARACGYASVEDGLLDPPDARGLAGCYSLAPDMRA